MLELKSYKKSLPQIPFGSITLDRIHKEDLPVIAALLQDKVFHDNTLNIPYPYGIKNARAFYEKIKSGYLDKDTFVFAVRENLDDRLVGLVGLHLNKHLKNAEIGYWTGREYWNQGFAATAVSALIGFAFEELDVQKIYATHFTYNPASGRVMNKAGMRYEAILKGHVFKNGSMQDLVQYGITKEDYLASRSENELFH